MSRIVSLFVGCVLTLATSAARPAPADVRGDAVRVEVSGRDQHGVRLLDAVTGATIARDRIAGEPMRDSLVSPDNTVVALRHGAHDDGDNLVVYAIGWVVDPVSGAKGGHVAQALDYRPRDGRLVVSLRPVPNGTVVQVHSGRRAPLWNKIFLYENASRRWYEWPRALAPNDPTQGMPQAVGDRDRGSPYTAWLRPLDATRWSRDGRPTTRPPVIPLKPEPGSTAPP